MRDPEDGIGKPEALRENLSGLWSRRIDDVNQIGLCNRKGSIGHHCLPISLCVAIHSLAERVLLRVASTLRKSLNMNA